MSRAIWVAALGSPPRVRGTASAVDLFCEARGITPACAGNRALDWFSAGLCEDHPRVCGEQKQQAALERAIEGSPPRVRGTAMPPSPTTGGWRITPACAGNSYTGMRRGEAAGDHPRVCGEQFLWDLQIGIFIGSPPRVRGTASFCMGQPERRWITPACAGNSYDFLHPLLLIKDHPRVCGEQYRLSLPASPGSGSPPRVRGTAGSPVVTVPTARITPACAGNSTMAEVTSIDPEDHPRVCGEQPNCQFIQAGYIGSPPRVRGTAWADQHYMTLNRITPACAGNRTT